MAGRLNASRGRNNGQLDDDLESITSFGTGPVSIRPTIKNTWSGNSQVDHDTYHRMVEDYRAAKAKESGDELKIRQLAAQLARTEEAAKRALVRSDQGAKGSTAQQLLDAQRQVQQLQAENSELCSKLAREKKRSTDFRSAAEENRRRLEAAMREQRALVRKLGEAERSLGGSAAARTAARKAAAEQEYWSEEAGRRFAVQQEELVGLREANQQLQQHLAAAVPPETAARFEATIKELQQLVRFYERRLMAAAAGAGAAVVGAAAGGLDGLAAAAGPDGEAGGGVGSWLLEQLVEGGACYLLERASGRVFSDAPDGQWPRPVGLKPAGASSLQLGCRGRLDGLFRALSDALRSAGASGNSRTSGRARQAPDAGSSRSGCLADALQQLVSRGGCVAGSCSSTASGTVDARDVPALLAVLLPGFAHKELAELLAWLQLGEARQQQPVQMGAGRQGLPLEEVEAAARDLLAAREAVRQGRDLSVNEVLLRVRRLLRDELRAVSAAFEEEASREGRLGGLQVLQLLRQPQLIPDLSQQEARQLLVLLHEWDLAGSCQHSLSDMCAALQLLKLVRLPPGSLGPLTQPPLLDRPDSRLSSTSTNATSTTAPGRTAGSNAAAAGGATGSGGDAAGPAGGSRKQQRLGSSRRLGAAGGQGGWEAGGGGSGAGDAAGVSPKEAYLRERVAALEQELAQAKSSGSAASNQQVDELRSEVARYQSRLAELENDFLGLEVVVSTEVGDYDAEMRKAWFTAAAFKKRYVEHKLELDGIRATADKMQAALDSTHKALHAEAARRMALEEAAAVARLEASRAQELAAALAAERAERLKLEKDYLELQGKAFAAPGGALAEVRVLREELLAARRERAVGEAREAELRREIANIKRQLEGVAPEDHRRVVREAAEAQRRLVSCELELRAALDKLELYRRTEDVGAAAAGSAAAGAAAAAAASGEPDEGKSEPELRLELVQLRLAMAMEAEELSKLRKLLDTEAAISLEAKAALEEAQGALLTAKAAAAQQLAKLQRELESRDAAIRSLQSELCGAYSGTNRTARHGSAAVAAAARAGAVTVSRLGGQQQGQQQQQGSWEELVAGLGPQENVIEIVVQEATLLEAELPAPDMRTFVCWEFQLHDSQATALAAGARPGYGATVRYVVMADGLLASHLAHQALELELFEARGLQAAAVGVAHLRLRLLLQDVDSEAALGDKQAWHLVDIIGSSGQHLGQLKVGWRVAKPLDGLLQEHTQQQEADSTEPGPESSQQALQSQQQQQAEQLQHALMVLKQAAEQADAEPAQASHLLVTIHRCEGLQQQQQQQQPVMQAGSLPGPAPAARKPYVNYKPPGRSIGRDTAVGGGPCPVFEDVASWALIRSEAVEHALQLSPLQVAVFDDSVDDPDAALLGLTSVPLGGGLPQGGVFDLVNPCTGGAAGRICISIAWCNSLLRAAVGSPSRQLKPRTPAAAAAAAATPAAAAAAAAATPAAAAAAAAAQSERASAGLQPADQTGSAAWPLLLQGPAHQHQHQSLLLQSGAAAADVSSAAAAAVTAALNKQRQQQQSLLQQQPDMQPDASGASAAAAVAAAIAANSRSSSMLLLPGQQLMHMSPPGHRYGSVLESSYDGLPLQPAPAGCSSSSTAARAPPAPTVLQGVAPAGAFASSSSLAADAADDGLGDAVMRRVSPAAESWGEFDTTVFFQVEALALSDEAAQDGSLQHVLVSHMFCEDFTSPAQQCTETLPARPGPLSFSYAVAYAVADPISKQPTPAGLALAAALAAAEADSGSPMTLPVLLASSQTPVANLSQVACVASCEINLSELWAGASGDIIGREFSLRLSPESEAYASGCIGQLRLTLVAARALATLKQHWTWEQQAMMSGPVQRG